ncbi:MAG TPA: hypothetical protein PLN52_19105 [Opitutaceae bacterium]|nr:hypothetical protein [Opitutaceae bacterium]
MKHRGYSLVEVVLSLGVFSGAILLLLGLLTPILDSRRERDDAVGASAALHAVSAELRREAFSEISRRLLSEPLATTVTPEDERVFCYVSRRDGVMRKELDGLDDLVSSAFYEATLIRDPFLSAFETDESRGVITLWIELTWPAFASDGRQTSRDRRRQTMALIALRRE